MEKFQDHYVPCHHSHISISWLLSHKSRSTKIWGRLPESLGSTKSLASTSLRLAESLRRAESVLKTKSGRTNEGTTSSTAIWWPAPHASSVAKVLHHPRHEEMGPLRELPFLLVSLLADHLDEKYWHVNVLPNQRIPSNFPFRSNHSFTLFNEMINCKITPNDKPT